MGPGCDHNSRFPGPERGTDIAADGAEKGRILGIKLDHMTVRIVVMPLRRRSSHGSVAGAHL